MQDRPQPRSDQVKALDKFGRHPDYPPTNNWGVIKRTQLVGAVSPGAISRRRHTS